MVNSAVVNTEVPRTYAQAMRSPDRDEWAGAVRAEREVLESMGTFELVPESQAREGGYNVLHSGWVFAKKPLLTGGVKFKGRVVARGNEQREGIDYHEVYAPVVNPVTMRVLLAIAAQRGYDVDQLDVTAAFLNGKLDADEHVYMRIPDGFERVPVMVLTGITPVINYILSYHVTIMATPTASSGYGPSSASRISIFAGDVSSFPTFKLRFHVLMRTKGYWDILDMGIEKYRAKVLEARSRSQTEELQRWQTVGGVIANDLLERPHTLDRPRLALGRRDDCGHRQKLLPRQAEDRPQQRPMDDADGRVVGGVAGPPTAEVGGVLCIVAVRPAGPDAVAVGHRPRDREEAALDPLVEGPSAHLDDVEQLLRRGEGSIDRRGPACCLAACHWAAW